LKQVVIHDACILIDLANGRLLAAYLRLRYATVTTDLIVHEIGANSPAISDWLKENAEVRTYTSEELIQLRLRKGKLSSALSAPDASVLFLAKERDALLFTNDRKLRRTAAEFGVRAHGVLMIMDALYEQDICTGGTLCEALTLMREKGARLPPDECSKRHETWRRT
jgi:predicted nucleic acid-binding protein